MASKTILSLLFCVLLILGGGGPHLSQARHRCPDPPPMKFSFFSSQVFFASSVASSTATGRTFNTSGCDKGHPSDDFYRPKGAIYLQNNLARVIEESSQGQGVHLEALARLAGCQTAGFAQFSQGLQKNYKPFFIDFTDLPPTEQADRIWHQVETMISGDDSLRQACFKAT